jgi:hypothetical protein
MIEVDPLGTINDFAGLQRIMRERKDQLGISNNCLDELAGLSDGYANKLMARPPAKNLGTLTFDLLLQALGLKLIVVEDIETMQRYASQLVQRQEKQVRTPKVMGMARKHNAPWLFSKRKARKLRELQLMIFTPEEQSIIARKAARNRWKRWRIERKKRKNAKKAA